MLATLEAKKTALCRELARLDALYRDTAEERKSSAAAGISSFRLLEYSNYLQELDYRKAAKQKEIDTVQLSIDRQTKILLQLRTEIKTLEKLREKQRKLYTAAQNKRQEMMIEDFVASRSVMA